MTVRPNRRNPAEGHDMTDVKGHILVVDDLRTIRLKLCRGLTQQGHTVSEAENGVLALERLRSEAFDLVLLDIVMPVMDGYHVLEQMKEDRILRDVPVIVISAMDDLESVVKGIELGAEDYLPKMFDPVLLRARIGACLEKKRLRDQEVDYLRNVARVTDAAAAVETQTFDSQALADVAARPDALGQLARVFSRMASEVYAREQRLKRQVQQLRIELDQARQARQVAEITESDYFQELQARAHDLRQIMDGP
jgi:two-component system cell cycle response regulator